LDVRIENSHDLEFAIKKYNSRFKNDWKFTALHELFENEFPEDDAEFFFIEVLPKMIELALRLPTLLAAPIPLLKKTMNHSITLSQQQVACLLSNAFLCTFPGRNVDRKKTDYPEINFNRLFDTKGPHNIEKIKCVLNYFKQVSKKMPAGTLTFLRRSIEKSDLPNWSTSNEKLSTIKLAMSSTTKIEEGIDMLQVDFANRFIGGGVLGNGCVQEEIRFMINPEMIVAMLFSESMGPREAIVMIGCQQFNKYDGYAKSFRWRGSFIDTTPRDRFRRKFTNVVAIDAISFTYKPDLQFNERLVERELNKAFTGFYHDPSDSSIPISVCGGNWGCGAFAGYKPLKALIQLMACCLNRRNLYYCSFGEVETVKKVTDMFEFLTNNDVTVG
jgi:poly(ADP-ribose) glycohydrolase